MPEWTCSDGTVVTLKGEKITIEWKSDFGLSLVAQLEQGAWLSIAPPGAIKLEPDPWLVDRWLRDEATRRAVQVQSAYVPSPDDIPPDALEAIRMADDAQADPPGQIY